MKDRFRVQEKRKGSTKWHHNRFFKHEGDAISHCGIINRVAEAGTVVHRVWDNKEQREVYRRGWYKG